MDLKVSKSLKMDFLIFEKKKKIFAKGEVITNTNWGKRDTYNFFRSYSNISGPK
jgi:hypothetical protein